MRKILCLVTVFMMVFTLTIPAFAVSVDDYDGFGYPSLPSETLPYCTLVKYTNREGVYLQYTSVESDSTYTSYGDSFQYHTDYLQYPSGTVLHQYALSGGAWILNYSGTSQNGWKDQIDNVLWANYAIKKASTGEDWVTAEVFCDGSSCPANDVNIDGICDDCGMTLSLRSLTYPAFPSVDGSNKHYALVKTKYSGVDAYMYSVFTSDVTYDIRGETPGTVYQIAVDGVADYIQYVTTDGQTWVEIQNSSVNNQSVGSGIVSQTTVIASTFNWYNGDGEHFFPVPLWVEVEEVTQGEMMGMGQMMGGTLKVLVPCGVGLMACLVVLGLFGKRLLIFRS